MKTISLINQSKNLINRAQVLFIALVMTMGIAVPAVVPRTASATGTNSVLEWNQRAETAFWNDGQRLPFSFLSFAIVQGAVYDAVNAIDGAPYQPYLVAPQTSKFASKDAAVAAASYYVLRDLAPSQEAQLQTWYQESLDAIPNNIHKWQGVKAGKQAAEAMLADRQDDGRDGTLQYNVGSQPGGWRPVPAHAGGPPFLAGRDALISEVRPFFLPDSQAYISKGPRALTSGAYAAELNEVKAVGRVDSPTRTADQTDAARFWHNLEFPWWGIVRSIAASKGLDVSDSARLMAQVHMPLADTVIAGVADKYHWSFWRPLTAIREADTDGNPATSPDSTWEPLIFTFPNPEHSAGHSFSSGSVVTSLQKFFGTDKISFSHFSSTSGSTRSYQSLSQALNEVHNARIWGGIHFRTATVQGEKLGKDVTKYIHKHHFRKNN